MDLYTHYIFENISIEQTRPQHFLSPYAECGQEVLGTSLSIEVIAVFVVSLVRISVVRMLQCLFNVFNFQIIIIFCILF